MKAVMDAHDQIKAGTSSVMVAGGMENMSQSPYLLPKGRGGMRMGHSQVLDSMFFDGLEDAYEGGLMGTFAQATADSFGVSREAMDNFAIESLKRANKAIAEGWFENEIAPVSIKTRQGEQLVTIDEQPGKANPDKIPQLRPAFKKDGTVTAANSSSISDGAAALVLMRESEAMARGLAPLADPRRSSGQLDGHNRVGSQRRLEYPAGYLARRRHHQNLTVNRPSSRDGATTEVVRRQDSFAEVGGILCRSGVLAKAL